MMKNIINYYYNFNISEIKQKNKKTYFCVNGFNYVFLLYEKDLNMLKSIYELNVNLLKRGINIHEIVLNINNQILTFVNGDYYILLKVYVFNKPISLSDILNLNGILINENTSLNRNNWASLWSEKNDYIEYQMNKLGKKYYNLKESFSYYLGFSECAIALMNDFDFNENLYLSHDRIFKEMTFFELYNPLNIIVDYKIRDSAEYFKVNFFNNINIKTELLNFFKYNNLSFNEWVLFFIRMLYPSYYFDMYEDIINEKREDSDILPLIQKNEEYEKILSFIYFNLRKFPNFPVLDFFEKKTSSNVNDFFN